MLYWRAEYGRTTEEGARQLLVPDDLTLVGVGKQRMAQHGVAKQRVAKQGLA